MSWAEIKKAINSNISKSLDVLITEKCNELLTKLNSVYNTVTVKGNIPSVKSVQRGVIGNSSEDFNITISSVNADKSIVLLDGPYPAYLVGITSTSITIRNFSNTNSSWQVIEFY